MPVRASRDTTYTIWTEGDSILLGVWYQDEFDQSKPPAEQLDKALFIDPVSPRSLMFLALHFLNAGLGATEMLFQRLQGARKPPAPPGNGGNGKVVKGTAWGQPYKPERNGDAPSEPE